MSLNREQAWQQVMTWGRDPSLLRHMRSVELVMRAAAQKYGGADADVERWGMAGLLHRDEIAAGCQMLGVSLEEHIQFIINSLTPHAAELAIQGRQI